MGLINVVLDDGLHVLGLLDYVDQSGGSNGSVDGDSDPVILGIGILSNSTIRSATATRQRG